MDEADKFARQCAVEIVRTDDFILVGRANLRKFRYEVQINGVMWGRLNPRVGRVGYRLADAAGYPTGAPAVPGLKQAEDRIRRALVRGELRRPSEADAERKQQDERDRINAEANERERKLAKTCLILGEQRDVIVDILERSLIVRNAQTTRAYVGQVIKILRAAENGVKLNLRDSQDTDKIDRHSEGG